MHQKREWDGPINMRHNLQLNKIKLYNTGLCLTKKKKTTRAFVVWLVRPWKQILIHNSGHKQKNILQVILQ